jgi:RAP domain
MRLMSSTPLKQNLSSIAASWTCAQLAPHLWTPWFAPLSPLRHCGLRACGRAAPEASGAAGLTCNSQAAPACLSPAPQVQAAAPVGDSSRIVDVLLTWPGGRVAVEVDGPFHFLRDASSARTILDTPTRICKYILEQWGYTVVAVRLEDWPYGAWESDAFRQSLAARLRAAGVPLPPPVNAAARAWAWPQAA